MYRKTKVSGETMRILCSYLMLLLVVAIIYSSVTVYAQQGYPQGPPRYPEGGQMNSGGGQNYGSMPGDEVSKSMVESYHEILPDKLTPTAARYFPFNTEVIAVISGVILIMLFITLEKHAVSWLGLVQEEPVVPEDSGEAEEVCAENNGGHLKEDAMPEEKYPQAEEGPVKSSS